MERRFSDRIIVHLNADLISDSIHYAGFIENLSKEGIYMITAPTKTPVDFSPGTAVELTFQLPSGNNLNLNGKIAWSYKTPPHGITNSIGIEIINPPSLYEEFLKTR